MLQLTYNIKNTPSRVVATYSSEIKLDSLLHAGLTFYMAKVNLTGKTFGYLIVLEFVEVTKRYRYIWKCLCKCGNITNVRSCSLISGHTKSCGCLHIEKSREVNKSHGKSKTVEYKTWTAIRARCSNPSIPDYQLYGARGIKVCERWNNSFENFFLDMGLKPSKKHSIDRIDVNGDYCPENCRWATEETQSRNKRNNRWLEYLDVNMIMQDWATFFNAPQENIIFYLKTKTMEEIVSYYFARNKTTIEDVRKFFILKYSHK